MVVFVLYVKADLEGVATMSFVDGANLCFSVRNPLSPDTDVRERIVVDTSALVETDVPVHGRHRSQPATIHFALKWEGEQTKSTIKVLTPTNDGNEGKQSGNAAVVRKMLGKDNGTFVPMLTIDCQGLEPYAFHPIGGEFAVTNTAGDVFDPVDLSSGDWSEYDLGSGTTSIFNLQSRFE